MNILNTLLPLTASVISFIFAFIVFKRYLNRRGPYLLLWGIGLLFLAAVFTIYPTGQVRHDDVCQSLDVCGVVVEGRDVAEMRPTGFQEDLARLGIDLVERLEAVCREPGANHAGATYALPPPSCQDMIGIWFLPGLRPEAGLERDLPAAVFEVQLLGCQASGRVALQRIWIATLDVAFGYAVERKQQAVGFPVFLQVALYALCQGTDVSRVVVVARAGAQLGQRAPGAELGKGSVKCARRSCSRILRE